MYLPPDTPDYDERKYHVANISSEWEATTHDTSIIPKVMRHEGGLTHWPIEIIRALSVLANDMPGNEGWNKFYDLVERGYKKRMRDKTNSQPARLQLIDIEYVREHAWREELVESSEGKGKQKMVETDMESDDADSTGLISEDRDLVDPLAESDDADSANKPGESSEAAATTTETDAPTDQQGDGSNPLPSPVLPTDSQDLKYKKLIASINYYWKVDDCRNLIREDILQRGNDQRPDRRRPLRSYGSMRKGEVLELLYELAKITPGVQRRDAAWAKNEEKWEARKVGTNGNKALSATDVGFTLAYFRSLPQQAGEESAAADGDSSVATLNDEESRDQDGLGEEVSLLGDPQEGPFGVLNKVVSNDGFVRWSELFLPSQDPNLVLDIRVDSLEGVLRFRI